jgi:uncharacterized membrane protein YfcA
MMSEWLAAGGSPFESAWPLLLGAAFLAGFVDSIVGGGGLIQIPVLFGVFAGAPAALLLGTNKVASVFGTAVAAVQYVRRVQVAWNTVVPATVGALAFAFLGAWSVSQIPPDVLRTVLPLVLAAVAWYTFKRKDFGTRHAPLHTGRGERVRGALAGSAIGFYDGFFGPGTGSFLIFVFVRWFGFDFIRASAAAKVVNVACNLAAITWFASSGRVMWGLALTMATANVSGALVGSRLAIARGTGFVRQLVLVVVMVLIVKTGYDVMIR